ncbi:hypothetical protein [Pelomonas cellulosilytica]|uniref:Uncharacterized protein n=1 Tax=Pelomonas cellulosilytica TaxID=2906762 RepID=A0ABS8Y3T2_9BURK|nr:hypothetical protein [Pelomonas sp. P8]MCE4556710.1 hypothetical protein [Pelomonas sp. P8]
MDYRSLLTIPLAAVALSASSAESLRLPAGWQAGASFSWPAGTTYLTGVAPSTDTAGQRMLTVQSVGQRHDGELGAISQSVTGYGGKRLRFQAQVKAAGTDAWAGLVVRSGFLPLHVLPVDTQEAEPVSVGTPACPDWCEVSVVADIPQDDFGAATVGLAVIGNGQIWARDFKLDVVGRDVPTTATPFAATQTARLRADIARQQSTQATRPTPPSNLALR